ncbi:MAG: WXG100 family type VII secretion target [Planctomycetota bacterium]|nr:WXG100 family type VII secretion target [Planctomycetota bacterium]
MKVGDLKSGATKLDQALKTLYLRWEQVQGYWKDEASRAFEGDYIVDIEPQVKAVLEAAARVSEVLEKAQREVS